MRNQDVNGCCNRHDPEYDYYLLNKNHLLNKKVNVLEDENASIRQMNDRQADTIVRMNTKDAVQEDIIADLKREITSLAEDRNTYSASNDLRYKEMINLEVENQQIDEIVKHLESTNEGLLERIVELTDEGVEKDNILKATRGNLDHLVGLNRELRSQLKEVQLPNGCLTLKFG